MSRSGLRSCHQKDAAYKDPMRHRLAILALMVATRIRASVAQDGDARNSTFVAAGKHLAKTDSTLFSVYNGAKSFVFRCQSCLTMFWVHHHFDVRQHAFYNFVWRTFSQQQAWHVLGLLPLCFKRRCRRF